MPEKTRIVIAFVLMFLIIVLWSSYMSKRRPPPKKATTEIAKTKEKLSEVVEKIELVQKPIEEKEVEIETALYKAVFTNIGGELKSFKLKNYEGKRGEFVELIPDGEKTLNIKLLDGIDLRDYAFEVISEDFYLEFSLNLSEEEQIVKKFHFNDENYLITLILQFPKPYRYILEWESGLLSTEANEKEDLRYFSSLFYKGNVVLKNGLKDIQKKKKVSHSGPGEWAATRTKYFIASIIPTNNKIEKLVAEKKGEKQIVLCSEFKPNGKSDTLNLYIGPIKYNELMSLNVGLEEIVDFGWKWIAWLSKAIFKLLKFMNRFVTNWGAIIIIFSTAMKLAFYPLTRKGTKSMRELSKLQPKMNEIKEKYKNDPKRMNREVLGLYKSHKVNPLGGCLPLLIQMPFFIALFSILRSMIELRKSVFVLWIKDLSIPDTLFAIGGFKIHILPLVMSILMIVQSRLTTTDPRQKMMSYIMPIMMLFIFWNFPSGLVLYWLTNNVLTIAEHYIIAKMED